MPARILVVDDNPDILDALELLLSLHDYDVVTANSIRQAMVCMERRQIDLVIQDMNFSEGRTDGEEGKQLFYQLRQLNPELPIIVITAWTHIENAVELIKAGAADYLPKPWDDNKLLEQLASHLQPRQTPQQSDIISHSPAMQQLLTQASRVAPSDINLMITGPNGAGKEKLADYIQARSRRSNKPWVKVNMGALPAELMEAELFGAEAGAYTGATQSRIGRFEAADGGTLFLDEIGNLSLSGQMKLLRVLQSGEYERLGSSQTRKTDVRVVAATNADLPRAIAAGNFREDLFYRLNVVALEIPSLNQRKPDIVPLAELFIGDTYTLSDSAKHALTEHNWPGNVRELENSCQRALVFASGAELTDADFNLQPQQRARSEAESVLSALRDNNWNIKQTAEALGMSRQALYRRIEKYQLSPDE